MTDTTTFFQFKDLEKSTWDIRVYNRCGDLDNITLFANQYSGGMMEEINAEMLINLESIEVIIQARSPKIIDLSRNSKLKYVDLIDLVDTEEIILPPDNHISGINIDALLKLKVSSLNALIDNIYKNAITYQVRDGQFSFSTSWVYDDEMLGPPSEEALNKLRDLQIYYDWWISPSL